MIVSCPGCRRRYRIDPSRLGGRRRLRCTACGRVFEIAEAPPPTAAAGPVRDGDGAPPAGAPLVLVGDEPREFRDLVCRTLRSLGCRVETTEDGEAAFRFAVARRPALMVLNVYLRKLLGVAVCEGVKGSPDLKGVRVVLVGSVFKSDRFVRGPRSLYGADDYFEDVIPEADLRVRLGQVLGRATTRGATAAPARPPVGPPAGRGAAPAGRPVAAPAGATQIEPRAEIRRLARIMLSDLKIYYPDRFERAVAQGRLFETFSEELTKGKDLIHARFPDLPDRIQVLAQALRDGLSAERPAAPAPPAGSRA